MKMESESSTSAPNSPKLFVKSDETKVDTSEKHDNDKHNQAETVPQYDNGKSKNVLSEEVEDDEYVSSLLSVHFGGGEEDVESEKGRRNKDNGNHGKIHISKHGETLKNTTESVGGSSFSSQAIKVEKDNSNTLDSDNHKDIECGISTTAMVERERYIPRPSEKRMRKKPPPKTCTVYNAELTSVATADEICLNIRLKERMEKHERKKNSPHEKTKYRTKKKKMAEEEKPDGEVDEVFPYQCAYCGMGFNHYSRLKLHERTHTGEKPYPCPFCDKAFSQNGYLKTHLKIHTGEKPYRCSVCDYSFRLSTTLGRHMRIHTGERPYNCSVCSRAFNQKTTLTKHMKVHSEEKPHKCCICHKGFRLIDTLRVHMQIHENMRPYICSICDKAFKTKGTLISHMKTHSRHMMQQVTDPPVSATESLQTADGVEMKHDVDCDVKNL